MNIVAIGGRDYMISKIRNTALPEIDNQKSADPIESSGTVIAEDTRLKGTITCRDQILVAGIVEGDIDSMPVRSS